MSAIAKWVQEKNPHPLISSFAPMIAAFASEIPEIFQHQKEHRLLSHTFPQPDPSLWSSFYTSPALYLNPFLQMLLNASPVVKKLFEIASVALAANNDNGNLSKHLCDEKELAELRHLFDELLKLAFTHMQEHFDDTDLAPEGRTVFQRYMDDHKIDLAFLYLIAFPCLLLFKETPADLYHKARSGDAKALYKILCLDPFMLNDPEIIKEVHNIRLHGKQRTFEKLLNAPLKPIKPKLTGRTYKDSLAGLISLLADELNSSLTCVDIRDLFDAVALEGHDESLPEGEWAFSKTIQRNRSEWKVFLQPGHKNLT